MSATETHTPEALRGDLNHLLSLACDVACAEERLAKFAKAMYADERYVDAAIELPYYYGAVMGAVRSALDEARAPRSGKGTSTVDAMLVAQVCQDALDVLDMAITRRDEEMPEAVAS